MKSFARDGFFPGFTVFPAQNRSRFRTALETSTWLIFCAGFCESVWINRFDLTINADDVQLANHIRAIHKSNETLKVAASETVIIEDSINGISAAVASGAITIGFLSSASPDEIPRADFYARNYTDISAILDKIAQD
jgi:hypothetical protein